MNHLILLILMWAAPAAIQWFATLASARQEADELPILVPEPRFELGRP